MNVGVLGGGLQGIEAAYLLRKAGHHVLMLDKKSDAPAKGLAHQYFCFDLLQATKKQLDAFTGSLEVIIPATENRETLAAMEQIAQKSNLVFCHDAAAYNISSSKVLSNRLFAQMELPRPQPWPQAHFPLLVKPSGGSGSKDINIVNSLQELEQIVRKSANPCEELVMEELLDGSSYSIEVAAFKGKGVALETTLLHFDDHFDCNQVIYPSGLDQSSDCLLKTMALQLAAALQLTGVMDLEVIHAAGELKVLEIDARLPSQTPAVVYHASGENLVSILLDIYLQGHIPVGEKIQSKEKSVIYEHLYYANGDLYFPGEHVMAAAKDLNLVEDFFGAEEAITNYKTSSKSSWVATVLVTGDSREGVEQKRNLMLKRIIQQ